MFESFNGLVHSPLNRYVSTTELYESVILKETLGRLEYAAQRRWAGDCGELMRGIHRLQPVVVVDAAHLLDREMLEEVRLLLNFKMDAQSPMELILVDRASCGTASIFRRIQRFANASTCIANCRITTVLRLVNTFVATRHSPVRSMTFSQTVHVECCSLFVA